MTCADCVGQVGVESVAAKVGLHAGDIVVRLAGRSADGMTYKDALTAIRAIGDTLEIIVERYVARISTGRVHRALVEWSRIEVLIALIM